MTGVLDLIFSSLIGAAVIFCFSEPNTKQQAIVAGLGFAGMTSTLKLGNKR